MTGALPLLSTYRVQLRGDRDLAAARALVPYLDDLGVTHLYSSPVLQARAGSTHGYDVVDSTRVDPALGGAEAFEALTRELAAHGMGLLLDIVPNHMAASAENPFWADVLAHGRGSRYARWFDVDWDAGEGRTRGKILLPILGERFATEVSAGRLQLALEGGVPALRYHDHVLPLDPATLTSVLNARRGLAAREGRARRREPSALDAAAAILRALPPRDPPPDPEIRAAYAAERARAAGVALSRLREARGDPSARAELEAAVEAFRGVEGRRRFLRLLARQSYALVHWRRARRELNYRRFFDVNELVGVRVERPEVFAGTHGRVLEWVRAGRVQALRIDHIDGLLDPRGYLDDLHASARRDPGRDAVPVVVEKILAPGERLPDWPVAGTTGYEFLNALEAVFHDPAGVAAIEEGYRRIVGTQRGFAEAARRGKRDALIGVLATDVQRLAMRLHRIARRRGTTAPRRAALAAAVVETIVHLPVYRTYVDASSGSPTDADRRLLRSALDAARTGGRAALPALDLLEEVLLPPAGAAPPDADERLAFVQRFQQTSGPAAAKGVEDTALYVHVALVSLNEVGGDPERPLDDAVDAFHAANVERARRWPGSLLATTTHDTKRSADARARLDVLSEVPAHWLAAVARWRRWNRPHRTVVGGRRLPDSNTEYLLHQSLLALWPVSGGVPEGAERAALRERLGVYALKAAREAKTHTSWIDPDPEFERALDAFVAALLPESGASAFLEDVASFAARVIRPALWNALSRTLVHLTAPGVPDLYQGDELWTFTLVDPDNRRPVDDTLRRRLLTDLGAGLAAGGETARAYVRGLVAAPEDGRLKLHVVRAALAERRRRPELFARGGYRPLAAEGARARHVLAFAREEGASAALIAVPRLSVSLLQGGAAAPVGDVWGDTRLPLPDAGRPRRWTNALTGAAVASGDAIAVRELFSDLPAALLVG